ncbi:flavin reductase family protein [Janibacter terrae]|uniref:flavin reductase family protein n=1 Tax=Janibacter terrae TaxID=103817 RepID=UPI0031F8BFAB
MATATSFDPTTFREVMGHYPTGVVVVTGAHPDGEALAMIVGTFTSASMEPPLVAFLPMRSSRTFQRLSECESLCINVLTDGQEALGRTIASRSEDKLEGIDWSPCSSGAPMLHGSLAWLDVHVDQIIEAGDHLIALCAIDDMAVNNPKAPLIFFQGGYGGFAVPSLLARIDNDIIGAVQQASYARDLLASLATRHRCEATLLTVIDQVELAAIATAVGEGINPGDGLGTRVPIIPPIADVWVAELSPEAQQEWLDRGAADEEARATFEDRLGFAREHGYLMSFLPAGQLDPYRQLNAATQRYAGDRVTPTTQREIRQSIADVTVSYQMRDIDVDEVYDVGMLVATIHDPEGRPVRMLRLAQLPRGASGEVVLGWIADLKAAVSELEGLLFDEEARTR